MKNVNNKKYLISIAAVFSGFTILIYRFLKWYQINFGDITFDQVVYHLNVDIGAGVPTVIYYTAARELLLKPILGSILIYFLIKFLNKKIVFKYDLISIFIIICALFLISIKGFEIYKNLEISDFIFNSKSKEDWLKDIYVKPVIIQDKKLQKNLIFIYLESMENRFVPPESILGSIAKKNIHSEDFIALPGTQWTIAAFVASQCSVPLMPVGLLAKNNMGYSANVKPLKNAVCLGDLLNQVGYKTSFIGGAKTEFAGKGAFLKQHGFTHVLGLNELNKLYPEIKYDSDWWGIYDSDLFEIIKKQLKTHENKNELFAVTLLTLDMHFPGKLSPSCKAIGFSENTKSIIECTIKQIDEFINWVLNQKFAENTNIVIMGDHPIMGNVIENNQNNNSIDRSVFFTLIEKNTNNSIEHSQSKKMTHFDIAPTVLHSLGIVLKDERMGLGSNLLNGNSFIRSKFNDEQSIKMLRKASDSYINLWLD